MEKEKEVIVKSEEITKPNYMLLSIQRICILLLILTSVVVIVYYTPMPEEYFEDCDRECHELDWPMICRVKIVVEVYKTFSKSCGNCVEKGGDCPDTCISADGRVRGVLSANRQLPAPALHVCQNDILVVDVVHRAPAHALAMHWRGQPQRETPFMDGAPMLTQCPQPAYTTFQYKFRASEAGTHMYHAHSAADAADGLAGALVVRQSPRTDPLKKYYDVDNTEYTLFIAEWGHSMGPLAGLSAKEPIHAESLLINGRGKTTESPDSPVSKFVVTPGKRYRFRLAYGGGTKSCPIRFSIDEHVLKLVALDGHVIEAVDVDAIELGKGERADFILTAGKMSGTFKVNVLADEQCQKDLKGVAELVYDVSDGDSVLVKSDVDSSMTGKVFSTMYSDACESKEVLCLSDVHSLDSIPDVLTGALDETIYIPFNYSTRKISAKRMESWGSTDGHRFTYPASPLLTQPSDVDPRALCSDAEGTSAGEECVHVKYLPLGATVEMVLFDQGGESDHIFHLHGYSFFVTGVRQFNASVDKSSIITMAANRELFTHRNLLNPVLKDTIVIPKFGAVALRFKADNPGYWLMRDERSLHWTRGLDFVLKVGQDSDFVQPPSDFPKCGSFVGPEYFLI